MAQQFYRKGTDIYEAGTNRYIGATEWGRDWSGKATETTAPADSGRTLEGTMVKPEERTLDVSTGQTQERSLGASTGANGGLSIGDFKVRLRQLAERAQGQITPTVDAELGTLAGQGLDLAGANPAVIGQALESGSATRAGSMKSVFANITDIIKQQEANLAEEKAKKAKFASDIMALASKYPAFLSSINGEEYDSIVNGEASLSLINKIGEYAKQAEAQGEGFTLSPGQVRFDAAGNQIAGVAENTDTSLPTSYEEWRLAGSLGSYGDWLKQKTQKVATIDQNKAAGFAMRMENDMEVFDNLVASGKFPTAGVGGAVQRLIPDSVLTNWIKSDEYQQQVQAERDFINAVLRRESGAVITNDEFANARIQYFPQPGDTEKTLEQKKKNRQTVYDGMKLSAGPALSDNVAEAETEKVSGMRTDRHNNPTALTVDVAKTLGMVKGVDYVDGDPFDGGVTAKLIGNPYSVTIKALDNAASDPNISAFYTNSGKQRWTHTAITDKDWSKLSPEGKKAVISSMYNREGGSGFLMQYANQ